MYHDLGVVVPVPCQAVCGYVPESAAELCSSVQYHGAALRLLRLLLLHPLQDLFYLQYK